MKSDLDTIKEIAARHGFDLATALTDPRDREIADLRERLAAAEAIQRNQGATIKRLLREQEEDRGDRARFAVQVMEALPLRRYPAGAHMHAMVLDVIARLRVLAPDLWERP